jgi:hypothetical protein
VAVKQRRRAREWPNGIVEIPSTRPDPRGDPQATQKISRADIDAVLQRTKSGTRAVVRPKSQPSMWQDEATDPDAPSGPRDDDAPEIMIVGIDSVEPSDSAPTSARPSAPSMPARMGTPARAMPADVAPAAATLEERAPTNTTAPSAFAPAPAPASSPAPPAEDVSRVALTPRLAFVTGIALVAFITLAALIGFLAGRLSGH